MKKLILPMCCMGILTLVSCASIQKERDEWADWRAHQQAWSKELKEDCEKLKELQARPPAPRTGREKEIHDKVMELKRKERELNVQYETTLPLTPQQLNDSNDYLAEKGYGKYVAIRGTFRIFEYQGGENTGVQYYDLICTRQGKMGLYRIRIIFVTGKSPKIKVF